MFVDFFPQKISTLWNCLASSRMSVNNKKSASKALSKKNRRILLICVFPYCECISHSSPTKSQLYLFGWRNMRVSSCSELSKAKKKLHLNPFCEEDIYQCWYLFFRPNSKKPELLLFSTLNSYKTQRVYSLNDGNFWVFFLNETELFVVEKRTKNNLTVVWRKQISTLSSFFPSSKS